MTQGGHEVLLAIRCPIDTNRFAHTSICRPSFRKISVSFCRSVLRAQMSRGVTGVPLPAPDYATPVQQLSHVLTIRGEHCFRQTGRCLQLPTPSDIQRYGQV